MARVMLELHGNVDRLEHISNELVKCMPKDVELSYSTIKCVCCGNVSASFVGGFPLCEEHKGMVNDLTLIASGNAKIVNK